MRGRDLVGIEHHQKPPVTAALLHPLNLNGILWAVRVPQRRLRELARLVGVSGNFEPNGGVWQDIAHPPYAVKS